jgi:AcrR family transcriptional regulator
VGAKPDPERRAELLSRAVDYIHEHGLAELSLRPLAAAMDTSARMLIYHFGSKEDLVTEALDGVRRRQQAAMLEWMGGAETEGSSFVTAVRRFWIWSSAPEAEGYGRLFFEVYGLSLTQPSRFPGFVEDSVRDWLTMIRDVLAEQGVDAAAAIETATAVLALHRGLLLDLFATGETDRVDLAHRRGVEALDRALRERQESR